MSNDATSTIPQSMPTFFVNESVDKRDYQYQILRTFNKDAVGKLCVTEELIVNFGHREFKTRKKKGVQH